MPAPRDVPYSCASTAWSNFIGRSDDRHCGILGHVNRSQSPFGRSAPTLTLFCGLPGSGKSTLASRLEAEGRGVRLSTDEWQATLQFEHTDTDLHERLQDVLYRHALALLRQGVDVILEDGLWMTDERTEKFADARSCFARIELHVFDVDYDTLWERLRRRNDQAESADYPMTADELNLGVGHLPATLSPGINAGRLVGDAYRWPGLNADDVQETLPGGGLQSVPVDSPVQGTFSEVHRSVGRARPGPGYRSACGTGLCGVLGLAG